METLAVLAAVVVLVLIVGVFAGSAKDRDRRLSGTGELYGAAHRLRLVVDEDAAKVADMRQRVEQLRRTR